MKHTIAFSDAHIHDDSLLDKIDALCEYVEARRPQLLVLVGDIADPWQKEWAEILQTKSWERLCRLCAARDADGLRTVYIRGNHDNGVKKKHLRGNPHHDAETAPLKRLSIKWRHREGGFLFIHGWQWDSEWGGPIGRILFWISRNMPFLMIPLYNCWSKLKGKTPSTLKGEGNTDVWTTKIRGIHDAAKKYARKRDLTVVLGHTHFPRITPFMVDAGDWVDSFSLVEITEDGTVAMKHWGDSAMKELAMEDRVQVETESVWPKEKTAILVIHGSGPHRPFETLDSFARGFRHALKIRDPRLEKQLKWKHELQQHQVPEPWVESIISLTPDGGPSIDFHEYYWDCYMVRDVTTRDLMDWIDAASAGACRFYQRLPHKAEEYESMGVDLFGDGEFTFRGYRILLGSFRRVRGAVLFLADFGGSVMSPVLKPLLGWASKHIDDLIGDVVIYTTSDVRSENYQVRQKMLKGAVEELKHLLADETYERIIVVGHSLGTVVAYDALNRIVLEMGINGDQLSRQSKKIAGLVTFGSPLDKIAFFFEERTRDESFVQRQILDQLHGFRKVGPFTDEESVVIESPIHKALENLIWLNFYHMKDPVSGSLDAYKVHQNILCTAKAKTPSEAHASYWDWVPMYRDIADHLFR